MIDPENSFDRNRLARSSDYWHRELEIYRAARRETIFNYIGFPGLAEKWGCEANAQGMMMNLIQMAGQARVVSLAYNDPRFLILPNVPGVDHIAVRLEEFLARYVPLIGVGNIGRGLALDSFAGYGIAKVDYGFLPPGVQKLTGQKAGPMCWRISQDNFGYDGSATCWEDVAYQWNYELVPLDAAQSFEPFLAYNPEGVEKLVEYNRTNENVNSRVHDESGIERQPMAMTRLVWFYFPHAGVVACWPANSINFDEIQERPLLVREWKGHPTGPYSVLNDLDISDNLLPVAQIESSKRLHFLFNELADITSFQATEARMNPACELGSQRDVDLWLKSADRKVIPVSSLAKMGMLEIPGPTQSQTAYMGAAHAMFKEAVGNLDDTLGLGATAPTAKQSELIRSATTARNGESRRKMDRVMESIARKLTHLALNDETLTLPAQQRIPGSAVRRDVSWLTPDRMPRNPDADDYLIQIIDGSMGFRSSEARLAALNEATAQITQFAMAVAQGIPGDVEAYVETQAKYRDLPELRDWFAGMLPGYMQEKAQAQQLRIAGDKPNGNYTRTNVSERSNAGALTESLTQFSDDGGRPAMRMAG